MASQEWLDKNRDRVRAQNRASMLKHRERAAATGIAWKRANPEKCAASYRRWLDKPGSQAHKTANENKRRAAILQRTPAWLTQEDHAAILAIYETREQLSSLHGVEYNVDHFYPLQGTLVSGLHVPENLRIMTKSANSRKHNKLI